MSVFNRKSNTGSKSSSDSPSVSRRRVNRSREEWDGYFADALNALLSTDNERIKEVTEEEAKTIVESAARIADAALEKIEERFKGL